VRVKRICGNWLSKDYPAIEVSQGESTMSDTPDTKLIEVLSHHYSETFEQLNNAVARRDRLFLYILLVILILLLYMSSPSVMSDWVNTFFNNQVRGAANSTMQPLIDVSVIGVVLLLALLSFSHTYFQTVLHIERQYDYVYQLEQQLSQHFGGRAFIREGDHYKKYRYRFSRWTKGIFWFLFPSLFFLFIVYWLIFLYTQSQAPLIFIIVDSLITVSILISLSLYVWALMKKK
jgi:hypothetical protein